MNDVYGQAAQATGVWRFLSQLSGVSWATVLLVWWGIWVSTSLR